MFNFSFENYRQAYSVTTFIPTTLKVVFYGICRIVDRVRETTNLIKNILNVYL